jgi:hypothetical protein
MSGLGPRHRHGRHETIVVNTDCQSVVINIEVDCGGTGPGQTDGPGSQGLPQPIPTPFLVIPSVTGDGGTRPIPVDTAVTNQSIQATITNPLAPHGWANFEIELSCVVANLGAVASPAAMAEFYVGAAISIWNLGHEALTAAEVKAATKLVGRVSFTVPAGASVTVACPVLWKPGKSDLAQQGVLVQVSDLFTDPWTAPFDAINDRHVARNDELMDPLIF